MTEKNILQCMKDCGCDEEMARQYADLAKEGQVERQIRFLKRHRKELMDQMHDACHKVDCVDYMIRELEQKK